MNQLVYKNLFDVVYTNNNASEIENYVDYDYSYYDYEYISNKTNLYPEPLRNDNGVSELCNYFSTSQNWRNFLIFNFVFLYLVPVFIMTASYGLIIKKVSCVKTFFI